MDPRQKAAVITIRSQLDHIDAAIRNIRDALVRVDIDEHTHTLQTHDDLSDASSALEDLQCAVWNMQQPTNRIINSL